MRILSGHFVVILAIIVAAGGSDDCLTQKKARPLPASASSRSMPSPLPASLEALYPPKAEQPVFLLRMFEMNMPLTGIVVDLFENDLDHAKANFEKFKIQYLEISKLVPEWQKEYPMKLVQVR